MKNKRCELHIFFSKSGVKMKKRLMILFLLEILIFPIQTKAIVTNSSYGIKIYFFETEYCKECEIGKAWLEEYQKENNGVYVEYINIKEKKILYDSVTSAFDLKNEIYPFIVIGSNYFIGFSNVTKSNLSSATKAYLNSDSSCDMVSKIKNKEDITDCMQKNKGIWKENKIILNLLTIGVFLVAIGFVGFLTFKNKKEMK